MFQSLYSEFDNPVTCYTPSPHSGCNTQFIFHGVMVDTILNRLIKQYTSIESLYNLLLLDTIFPERVNIRAPQILLKMV